MFILYIYMFIIYIYIYILYKSVFAYFVYGLIVAKYNPNQKFFLLALGTFFARNYHLLTILT